MRVLIFSLLGLTSCLAEARLPDLIPYRKGNLWGYCDSTKKIVIKPQWEFTTPFQGNTAVVKLNGKFGLVDKSGKTTTGYVYSQLDEESRYGKRVAALKKNRVGLIDESGRQIITCQYSRIYWESDKYLRVHNGGSAGEIDSSGKIVIPIENYSTVPEQGFYYGESAKFGYFVFYKGFYKFGVLDSTGKTVIPFRYDDVLDLQNGYFVMIKHGKAGVSYDSEFVYNPAGKIVNWKDVPPQNYTHHRYTPWLIKRNITELCYLGWMDSSHQLVHADTLLFAGYFRMGLAAFMNRDSLCGFVDEDFQEVIPPKYGWCSAFNSNSLALTYTLHHHYPKRRSAREVVRDYFDIAHRKPSGYIDIHGTEYWED